MERRITPRMMWSIHSWIVNNTTRTVDRGDVLKIPFPQGVKIIGEQKAGNREAAVAFIEAALSLPHGEIILKAPAARMKPKPGGLPKIGDIKLPAEPKVEPEPDAEPDTDDEVAAKLKEIEEIFMRREAEAKRRAEEEAKKKGGIPAVEIKTPDYIPPKYFALLAHIVKGGAQVLLTGPAGCGKSRLAAEVAKVLDKPYYFLPLGGGVRYRQIFGGDQIVNGETRWEPGPLLRWIQEPCVILLDEIFGADPDVLLGLNPLLEPSTRSIMTPMGEIKMNPECRVLAAANTLGRQSSHRQYTGAQRADDSLLDRFLVQPCGYDPEVEAKILESMGLNGDRAPELLGRVVSMREKVKANQVAFDVSTRRLIQAARLILTGVPIEDAVALAITNSLTDTERTRVL